MVGALHCAVALCTRWGGLLYFGDIKYLVIFVHFLGKKLVFFGAKCRRIYFRPQISHNSLRKVRKTWENREKFHDRSNFLKIVGKMVVFLLSLFHNKILYPSFLLSPPCISKLSPRSIPGSPPTTALTHRPLRCSRSVYLPPPFTLTQGLMPVPPVRPDLLPPVQAAPRLFADLRQARQGVCATARFHQSVLCT